MSAYQPPRENLVIFDNSVFTDTNGTSITRSEADLLYLKFPLGQGAETVPTLTALDKINIYSPSTSYNAKINIQNANNPKTFPPQYSPSDISNGIQINSGTGDDTDLVLFMGVDATNNWGYIQSSRIAQSRDLILNPTGGYVYCPQFLPTRIDILNSGTFISTAFQNFAGRTTCHASLTATDPSYATISINNEADGNYLTSNWDSSGNALQISSGDSGAAETTLFMGVDKTNTLSYIQSKSMSGVAKPLWLNAQGGSLYVGHGLNVGGASLFSSSLDISNNPINFAGGAYMSWNTSVPAVAPNRVHFLTSTASGNLAALTISTDAARVGINSFNPLYTLEIGGDMNVQTQANAASVLISSLAGGGNRSISVNNAGLVIITPSDKRLKKDINCLSGNIIDEYFDKLNPVEYKWIDDETYGQQKEYGFIANEIKELYPNLIYRASIDASGNEFMGFNQPSLIPILTSVIQKLKSRLIQLEDKYALLEDNVAMLLSRI